jgi:hypothetical protein
VLLSDFGPYTLVLKTSKRLYEPLKFVIDLKLLI